MDAGSMKMRYFLCTPNPKPHGRDGGVPAWTLRWMQWVSDLIEEQWAVESTTSMMSGQQVEGILFHPSNTSLRNGPGKRSQGLLRSGPTQQESTRVLRANGDWFSQHMCQLRWLVCPCWSYTLLLIFSFQARRQREYILEHHGWSSFPTLKRLEFWS